MPISAGADEGGKQSITLSSDMLQEIQAYATALEKGPSSGVYREGSIFAYVASHKVFEYTTLLIISFNAIWIGVDIDYNAAESLANAKLKYVIVENVFCFYFSYEVLCRFLAYRRKKDSLHDAWFVFDFTLVVFMVLETWLFPIILSGSSSSVMGSLSILRLLRLLRLTRMARLMRQVPELVTLLKGMGAASRSVASTLTLLVIILYVFGIIFAGQFSPEIENPKCADCKELWGSVPLSMFTLFVAGTLLDDITVVCDRIRSSPVSYMLVVFYIYVLLSSFTVLNMLIGVVCEVISTTAASEKEEAMVSHVNQLLTEVFNEIDLDSSGRISKKEFDLMTEKEDVIVALTMLDVQPKHLMALSDTLFEADGDDLGEDKELSFQEFLQMIILLRPQNNASVLDVAQLRKTQRRLTVSIESKLLALEDRLDPNGEKRQIFAEKKKLAITLKTAAKIDKMRRRLSLVRQGNVRSSFSAGNLIADKDSVMPSSPERRAREDESNGKINELRILLDRQRERYNRVIAEMHAIETKIGELNDR